jgi:uncharacterized cofD-like protein
MPKNTNPVRMHNSSSVNNKKIVVLCGGSGGSELLTCLRGHASITAILPATDDGGSGGWCREKFNMIAPGDFRRALVALSFSKNTKLKKDFLFRYNSGEMKGHVVGNLAIATAFEKTKDFDKAISEMSEVLDVRDTILPVTKELTTLCAELEDGAIIKGERNFSFDSKHSEGYGNRDMSKKIKRVFTEPVVQIHPQARKAILEADAVILSVGDIYSSIIANLVIDGVGEALQKTKAKVVMFVNSLACHGESEDFNASDFVKTVERYIGAGAIDIAIVSEKIQAGALKEFAKLKPHFAKPDIENLPKHVQPVLANWNTTKGAFKADPKKVLPVLRKLGVL